jgi:hypothetical protein
MSIQTHIAKATHAEKRSLIGQKLYSVAAGVLSLLRTEERNHFLSRADIESWVLDGRPIRRGSRQKGILRLAVIRLGDELFTSAESLREFLRNTNHRIRLPAELRRMEDAPNPALRLPLVEGEQS